MPINVNDCLNRNIFTKKDYAQIGFGPGCYLCFYMELGSSLGVRPFLFHWHLGLQTLALAYTPWEITGDTINLKIYCVSVILCKSLLIRYFDFTKWLKKTLYYPFISR